MPYRGPRRCSICLSDEKAEVVNTLLATGKAPRTIEAEVKARGLPIKEETIRLHRNVCLKEAPEPDEKVIARAKGKTKTTGDFATLVQREAISLLESGQLRIRTADGLQAQALLDRRAEKAADRDLMVNLARLMTASRPPDDIIEGDFREVAPLALVSGD